MTRWTGALIIIATMALGQMHRELFVTTREQHTPAVKCKKETVSILIPIRSTNTRRHRRLTHLILSLEGWPREDQHVVMLASKDSFPIAQRGNRYLREARPSYASVRVLVEPESLRMGTLVTQTRRHAAILQRRRRERLARTRNYLWATSESYHRSDWTLWLDSDLLEVPPTLLVDLRQSNVDLVVPSCYYGDRIYDLNSWQATRALLDEVSRLRAIGAIDDKTILLMGYKEPFHSALFKSVGIASTKSRPLFLDDLARRSNSSLVPLHGVGATCILVRSRLYHRGLKFPYRAVNHAIESEGLAQLALRMGVQPYGRTDVRIEHA
ncbi:hypothetical protein CTAYLR_008907 [Chrysophaeum taylorii]|uniref:Glycosyltransferase family 62 protein n=1 Tax=Chrysophaeum taylorii TaxID=2483200 RepID=A0AAD7XP43_9STRA|nr:hypothetical protein CTAYLR_008907 [Chrysophaeum taylorii]